MATVNETENKPANRRSEEKYAKSFEPSHIAKMIDHDKSVVVKPTDSNPDASKKSIKFLNDAQQKTQVMHSDAYP